MVQLKYYGDDRDYFKYDLISFILEKSSFKNYGYVPMLTEHRYDNEGNITPNPSDCKSKELLNFIHTQSKPDLNNWELWLKQYVSSYDTINPANTMYFNNNNRTNYWAKYKNIICASNSLVFFDPDTGMQAGRITPIQETNKEKYILNNEIPNILAQLSTTSAFLIYQHLQRDSNRHELDIKNKINAISAINTDLKSAVYREKDLAFIFITKNDSIYKSLNDALIQYKNRSTVDPRGLH